MRRDCTKREPIPTDRKISSVKRRRKVGIHQRPSDTFCKIFIVLQYGVNCSRKAAVSILI